MNRLASWVLAIAVVSSSGCAFRFAEPSARTGSSKSSLKSNEKRDCAPNQYWDGDTCRHKGKGKGARKHDG